jgi:hypothetical protein
MFFDDYCILSSNRNVSRGYLHGLPAMVSKADLNSELVQACTLIALANLGSKLGNAAYRHRAESLYSSLLRSFRLSISNQAVFTTVESLITATLLGLYEVRSHKSWPKRYADNYRSSLVLVHLLELMQLMPKGYRLFLSANSHHSIYCVMARYSKSRIRYSSRTWKWRFPILPPSHILPQLSTKRHRSLVFGVHRCSTSQARL